MWTALIIALFKCSSHAHCQQVYQIKLTVLQFNPQCVSEEGCLEFVSGGCVWSGFLELVPNLSGDLRLCSCFGTFLQILFSLFTLFCSCAFLTLQKQMFSLQCLPIRRFVKIEQEQVKTITQIKPQFYPNTVQLHSLKQNMHTKQTRGLDTLCTLDKISFFNRVVYPV